MFKRKFLFLIVLASVMVMPAKSFAALTYAQAAVETAGAAAAAVPKSTFMWWHASPKEGWCQSTGMMSTSMQMEAASKVINLALAGMNQSWLEALSGKTAGMEGEITATGGYYAKTQADLDAKKARVESEIMKYEDALGNHAVGVPCVPFSPGPLSVANEAISGRLDMMMSADMRNLARGMIVNKNGKASTPGPIEMEVALTGNAAASEASGSYFTEYDMFTDEQWAAWNAFRGVFVPGLPRARPNFTEAAMRARYNALEAASSEIRTIVDKPLRNFANDRRADIPFEPLRPWLGFSIPTPFAMPMAADANGAISVKRAKPPTEGEIKEYVAKVQREVEVQNGGPLTSDQAAFVEATARQYAGTRYSQSGSRDPLSGSTDCSGYVWKIGSDAGVFSGGRAPTAADISQRLDTQKGGSLGAGDLSSGNLSGDVYIIGVAEANGNNGRWNNVSHTVIAYRDPSTGKMMVTEAQGTSGAGQTVTYDYDKWYARQQQTGRNLYGADMTQDFGKALDETGQTAGAPGGTKTETQESEETVYTQETNLKISRNALLRVVSERYLAEDFYTRLDLLAPAGILKEHMRLQGFNNLLMKEIHEDLRLRNLLNSIDGTKILKTMAAEKEAMLHNADVQ